MGSALRRAKGSATVFRDPFALIFDDEAHDFDYRKARPNRFALRGEGGHLVVVLDPDVAQAFTTSAAVNAVLHALITTMPKTA
jgi:hypothetical protein